MLRRKKNNSGMSLIEVIVSMLVLSIAVVTVMSAFSMATKVNSKTKKLQSTESLMEDMIEYAETGGEDMQGWFGVSTSDYILEDLGTIKKETLKNVQKGFDTYTVTVTTNTDPAKYDGDELNNLPVIQFGGAGSNTLLIDASQYADDDTVHDYYYNLHSNYVDQHNTEEYAKEAEEALLGNTYTPDIWPKAEDPDGTDSDGDGEEEPLSNYIDREIRIKAVSYTTDKMQLLVSKVYTVDTSLRLPDGIERTYEIPVAVSEEYDARTATGPSPKMLDQIYLLYPAKTKETNTRRGKDIRLLDEGEYLRDDVRLFVVNQATSSITVGETMVDTDRFSTSEKIVITCMDGANSKVPKKIQVYAPVTIETDASPTNLIAHSRTMVATDTEVRIVTVLIEITDDKGTLVADEEITRLQ